MVRVWEVSTGKLVRTLEGHYGISVAPTTASARSDFNSSMLIHPARSRYVRAGELDRGATRHCVGQQGGPGVQHSTVGLLHPPPTLVGLSIEIEIGCQHFECPQVWEVGTGRLVRTLKGHSHSVHALVSP